MLDLGCGTGDLKAFLDERFTDLRNLLDAAVFSEHALLAGHDIEDVAAFCRKLAPGVEVMRGYTPDDATFVMRRALRQ